MKDKLCITDSKLFLEVANVLGKVQALEELMIAYRGYYEDSSSISWSWDKSLISAFEWTYTPQRARYWERIYDKIHIESIDKVNGHE